MERKLIRELMHASQSETALGYMLDEFRELIKTDIVLPDVLCTDAMDKKFEDMYAKAKELDGLLMSIMHDVYSTRMKIMKEMEGCE